jgi:hypothetical protein
VHGDEALDVEDVGGDHGPGHGSEKPQAAVGMVSGGVHLGGGPDHAAEHDQAKGPQHADGVEENL